MENTNPQSFKDVKVFVGDNFHQASDATYKNLIWEQNSNNSILKGPSSTDCQAGWSEFNGECYKYFSQEKTWDVAVDQCVAEEVIQHHLCL